MNDENTQLILRAIDQLNHQFSEFGERMARLEQKVDIIGESLSAVENRLSSLEYKVDSIDGRLSKVERKSGGDGSEIGRCAERIKFH